MRIQTRVRSLARLLGAALVVQALAGVAGLPAQDAGAPQPPGRLVDVGGWKLHINCAGTGSQTVVLIAGAGAFSTDWYLVHQALRSSVRVCSYDRSGLAWSELGPKPRTKAQAVRDLHVLLARAGERGPFIMVGHSSGGELARAYAIRYPSEVAGMLLLDLPTPSTLQFINGRWTRAFWLAKPRSVPAPRETVADSERTLSAAELEALQPIRKMMGPPAIEGPFEHLPAEVQRQRIWAMSQPAAMIADDDPFGAEELVLMLADQIRDPHSFGRRPLIVIGRTPDTPPAGAAPTSGAVLRIQERPDELRLVGELSANSIVVTADSSRHEIHLDQPLLVVRATRLIQESIRAHASLAPLTGPVQILSGPPPK